MVIRKTQDVCGIGTLLKIVELLQNKGEKKGKKPKNEWVNVS